jgi:hypothetical protein
LAPIAFRWDVRGKTAHCGQSFVLRPAARPRCGYASERSGRSRLTRFHLALTGWQSPASRAQCCRHGRRCANRQGHRRCIARPGRRCDPRAPPSERSLLPVVRDRVRFPTGTSGWRLRVRSLPPAARRRSDRTASAWSRVIVRPAEAKGAQPCRDRGEHGAILGLLRIGFMSSTYRLPASASDAEHHPNHPIGSRLEDRGGRGGKRAQGVRP